MRDQVKDIAEYLADKCIFTATENSSYELKERRLESLFILLES